MPLTTTLLGSWKRLGFRVRMAEPDGWCAVDGIVMEGIAPLFGLHIGLTHWVDVTHMASGRKVASFRTLGSAMDFTHRAAHLPVAWDDPELIMRPLEAQTVRDLIASMRESEERPLRISGI